MSTQNFEKLADKLLSAYARHREETGGTVGVRDVFVEVLKNELGENHAVEKS